jgi:RAD51-like protein 1
MLIYHIMEQEERLMASGEGRIASDGRRPTHRAMPERKSYMMLSRLQWSQSLQQGDLEKLENYNIHTVRDLLSRTVWDIHEILGTVSLDKVKAMLEDVAKEVAPISTTAKVELKKNWVGSSRGYLSTCLEPLDSVLDGGIRAGVITEIVGPAGLGKTQFCLGMCVIGCLNRLEDTGRIFYIDTEKKFSAERLSEIAKSRFPESFVERGSMGEMLKRVIVQAPNSTREMLSTLQDLQGAIIGANIVLIIIDSIAPMFRSEFGNDSIVERQKLIGQQASMLKSLAESFNIPILVTNQITTKIQGRHSWLAPALGTVWSHAVNTRLSLSADVQGQPGRSLWVSKSSFAPSIAVPYYVTRKGIEVDDSRSSRFVSASEGSVQRGTGLYTEI